MRMKKETKQLLNAHTEKANELGFEIVNMGWSFTGDGILSKICFNGELDYFETSIKNGEITHGYDPKYDNK